MASSGAVFMGWPRASGGLGSVWDAVRDFSAPIVCNAGHQSRSGQSPQRRILPASNDGLVARLRFNITIPDEPPDEAVATLIKAVPAAARGRLVDAPTEGRELKPDRPASFLAGSCSEGPCATLNSHDRT